jgi:dihydroorotase
MSLVHQGAISLTQLISKLTCEPAKVIGRNGELGALKAGTPASITILNLEHEWIVDSSNFASKGKNTPYDGDKFKGKVMATVTNGRIAYIDDSLSCTIVPSP